LSQTFRTSQPKYSVGDRFHIPDAISPVPAVRDGVGFLDDNARSASSHHKHHVQVVVVEGLGCAFSKAARLVNDRFPDDDLAVGNRDRHILR
jgi:hypothetical protein